MFENSHDVLDKNFCCTMTGCWGGYNASSLCLPPTENKGSYTNINNKIDPTSGSKIEDILDMSYMSIKQYASACEISKKFLV